MARCRPGRRPTERPGEPRGEPRAVRASRCGRAAAAPPPRRARPSTAPPPFAARAPRLAPRHDRSTRFRRLVAAVGGKPHDVNARGRARPTRDRPASVEFARRGGNRENRHRTERCFDGGVTMRVLVTGGAGYIGSVTAAALIDAGHEVTVLDDLSRGHREFVPDAASLVIGDVSDPGTVHRALDEGLNACVHFAGRIEAGESMRVPETYFAANTGGTLRLLEVLVGAGIERFVLSSTAAVYGDPVRLPIREDDPTEPTNAYGASKLLAERALEWVSELRPLRVAALRYFNACGATPDRGELHDPETHLIPLVLEVAAGQRDEIAVFGTDYPTRDGTCVRDYVHVADLADAHVRALEALGGREQLVCNLGGGAGVSVHEVIEAARRVTGHPIPVRTAERRPGDPAELVASSDRAREVLGWEPHHRDLDAIVASAWDWHRHRLSDGMTDST
ncbi:UDP-glucose 4-epimerase GalE [Egibacter rhizosphaerae]|uniref:UDP-glucose 4-epimerase n=1 Tax=Egibacter rhizosphaerae TaxID=1670831 RepID=A0A411YLP4_9ACTN|nr:UDP-glucose 4-epimerase GalE [Egibacter rhizosphaerae]